MEYKELNKTLALFEGFEIYELNGHTHVIYDDCNHRVLEDTAYHNDWNWLMRVVEKIDDLLPDDSVVQISYNRCVIDNYEYGISWDHIANSRIEACYKAVCDFVEWYYSNNDPVYHFVKTGGCND